MAANTVPLAEASAEAAGRTLPNDELARTAAQVLASVAHDSSAKFASSSFMGLMRQLRDVDVALDGDKLVPREEAQAGGWGAEFAADLKGKGKQRADGPTHMGGSGSASGTAAAFNFGGAIPAQAASSTARISPTARAQELPAEHDANDAYFAQENADYMRFWADADTQRFGPAQAPASSVTSQDADWGHLQGDWDRFEATASGIRAVEPYPFAPHNPYLGTMMRQHALHGGAPALEDVCVFRSPWLL
jgi:peroxin-5